MTTGNKIMWKRGEIEQYLLFSTLFYIYISNFRSQITYSFVKCGCSIYCFPHSLNSDMSRYGYLELFQWVPWNSRWRESTVHCCIRRDDKTKPSIFFFVCILCFQRQYFIQSTLVISNSKGLSEILRDIHSSTYQVCRIEKKNNLINHI